MLATRASLAGTFIGVALVWPGVGEIIAIPYAIGLVFHVAWDWVKP